MLIVGPSRWPLRAVAALLTGSALAVGSGARAGEPDGSSAALRLFNNPDIGDERVAEAALFANPAELAVGAQGTLFVYDALNHSIRRIQTRTSLVDTVVGTGQAGFTGDGAGGRATALNLDQFRGGLAVGADGMVYLSDTANGLVRRWDPVEDRVTIVAGRFELAGDQSPIAPASEATAIGLSRPGQLALAADGGLFVQDDRGVLRVDLAAGLVDLVEASDEDTPLSFDVAPDGRLVVCADDRIEAIDLDARARQLLAELADFQLIAAPVDGLQCNTLSFAAASDDADLGLDVPPVVPPGQLIVASRGADPASATGLYGALFRLDLDTPREPALVAGNDRFFPETRMTLTDDELVFAQANQVVSVDLATAVPTTVGGNQVDFSCSVALESSRFSELLSLDVDGAGNVHVGATLFQDEQGNPSERAAVLRMNEVLGVVDAVVEVPEIGVMADVALADGGTVFAALQTFAGAALLRAQADGSLLRRDLGDPFTGATTDGDFPLIDLAASPDGRRLLVAQETAAGDAVCVVDGATLEVDACFEALRDPASGAPVAIADLAVEEGGATALVAAVDLARIYRLDLASGALSPFAGTGTMGIGGEDGPAREAELDGPTSVAIGVDGTVYVMTASRVLTIDPATSVLARLAGTGSTSAPPGAADVDLDAAGSPPRAVPLDFGFCRGRLAVDEDGDVYLLRGCSRTISVLERNARSVRGPDDDGTGRLGEVVAATETTIVIGAPDDLGGAGSVSIFENRDCRLRFEQRLTVPEGFSADAFGRALAIDGDQLVIGAARASVRAKDTTDLGAAIFERTQLGWQLKQVLAPPGDDAGAAKDFGRAVAIDGPLIAVGAPELDDGAGEVFLWRDAGASFTAEAPLAAPPGAKGFGSAVALADGLLAAGAPGSGVGDGASGLVALFEQVAGNLQPLATLEAPTPAAGDRFGAAVAIGGESIVVGAPGASLTGRAFLYPSAGRAEVTAMELMVPELGGSADAVGFGSSVSLEGDLVVVGAPGAAADSGASGALYGFTIMEEAIAGKGLGPAVGALQKIDPRFYQQGLGTAVTTKGGRSYAGAPASSGGNGDALAAEVIFQLGGLAGLWYDPTRDGDGFSVVTSEAGLTIYFFGFDERQERIWLVTETSTERPRFGETLLLDVFEVTAGTFATPAPMPEAREPWGNLRVTFNTANNAVFELNGRFGRKLGDAVKLLGAQGADAALSGLWFDPALPGEGYSVVVADGAAVLYYFGSTADGERLWLASETFAGTFEADQAVLLDVFESVDGTFEEPTAAGEGLRFWGTLEARFSSCSTGEFRLAGTDGDKRSVVTRLAGVVDTTCRLETR